MQPAAARDYLENMPLEADARKKARELVSARLNGVQWRWKQRALHKDRDRGSPMAKTERTENGVTVIQYESSGSEDQLTSFFNRFHEDGQFWDAYGAALSPTQSEHARGKKWVKRRRALISMWCEILVRGEATPKHLAEGDKAAKFPGLSQRHYERLLKSRIAVDAPPYVLDGVDAKPRRVGKPREWNTPHATRGGPTNGEVGEMFDLQLAGYAGLEHVRTPNRLFMTREANMLHPPFAKSLTTLRDELLQRIQPLTSEPGISTAASVLADDIRYRWWPLRALHEFISQDVALDWWNDKTNVGRGEILARTDDFHFTRTTVKKLVSIHHSAVEAPLLSDDAIALLLIQDAGTIGWRNDQKATSNARLAVADVVLHLEISPRMRAAILLDKGGAHRSVNEAENAEDSIRKAREILDAHPDESLTRLAEYAATGQAPRLHAQSYGGATYYEIIGLH